MIETVSTTVVGAFVVVPYLVGFAVSLPVRSWRGFRPALAAAVIIAAAALWGLTHTSFYVSAVLLFPVAGFVVGILAGFATRAVVLAARWSPSSFLTLLATLFGITMPMAGWVGLRAWRDLSNERAIAALPDAATLPAVAACDRFRAAGPLLDTVLRPRYPEHPDWVPRTDIALRYPAALRNPWWPRVPDPRETAVYLQFAMHIADAGPIGPGERSPVAGRRPQPEVPSVDFGFDSRPPIDREFARLFEVRPRPPSENRRSPTVIRTPTAVPDLDEITSIPPHWRAASDDVFATTVDGSVVHLLVCSKVGSVPNPQCRFSLDRGGLAIDGHFRRTELAHWPVIADHLGGFVDCARAAGDAVAAKSGGAH